MGFVILTERVDTLTEEYAIANSRGDSSSTKVRNARHPRGTCGNAAWRLHYFWGEKCPFLLEDSSPKATRARLVKILRTAYKLDREPSCLPRSFTLFFISISASSSLLIILYLQSCKLLFRKRLRNRRHNSLFDARYKFVLIWKLHGEEIDMWNMS